MTIPLGPFELTLEWWIVVGGLVVLGWIVLSILGRPVPAGGSRPTRGVDMDMLLRRMEGRSTSAETEMLREEVAELRQRVDDLENRPPPPSDPGSPA